MSDGTDTRDAAWLREPERATPLGIRVGTWALRLAYRTLGRGFVRGILHVVAFAYAAASARVRSSSRVYLRRLWPDAGLVAVVRHVATFATCTFDRLLFARGDLSALRVEKHGEAHLEALARARRGALLVGAHLGSFEALRAMGVRSGIVIHALVHFDNARQITAMSRAVAPEFDARVIAIDPDAPHWVLRVQACIEAGEFVAVLGDRTGLGQGSVEVDFLGGRARLPTGPWALAAVLRCPVLLTFGLYHAPSLYALWCEPFAERIELPRASRETAAVAVVQRYAERLEFHLRRAPYCWFNFFDLWR